MSTQNELNTDLKNIMTDFSKLKEFYLREQMLRRKFQGITKNLEEENKILRDLEKAERNKLNISRQFTVQQQDTISNLLEVKNENIKLSEHVKQLEANLADLKMQLATEKAKRQTDQEKMKLNQSQEIEELKLSTEKRVMEAKREVEDMKASVYAQYTEMAKKLENVENEKSNEINIIVFEYEERLHKLEVKLKTTEAENQQIRNRAAAEVILYQKKVLALEQQFNSMIQEKGKSSLSPLPPNSSESFIPETKISNKPFQYHVISNINQSQHSSMSLRPILKKTSVYNPVQYSSAKKNVLPSENDLANPGHIGMGCGNSVEYNTANICAEASPNSPCTVSASTNRFIGNSTVATRGSIMPQLQFVVKSVPDTVTSVPLKQDYNPSPQGKRIRFAAVKKRKLFRSNDQDTL